MNRKKIFIFLHNTLKSSWEKPNSFTPFGLFLYFLTGISFLYAKLMKYREQRPRKKKVFDPSVKIISVGNLTLGGTGKTPLVAWMGEYLNEKFGPVGIVLRGYGRKKKSEKPLILDHQNLFKNSLDSFGDEALFLSEILPDARIAVCANREKAVEVLYQEQGCKTIILDDAFQNLHLPKAMDIVCLDTRNPLGNGFVFPRGNLREPVSALKRGTHFVFLKGKPRSRVLRKIKLFLEGKEKNIYSFEYIFAGAFHLNDPLSLVSLEKMRKGKPLLLSSIGDPRSFQDTLLALDIDGDHEIYPDHFLFDEEEIRKIDLLVKEKGYSSIITTEKDAIRLKGKNLMSPCFVIEMQLKPSVKFMEELGRILS